MKDFLTKHKKAAAAALCIIAALCIAIPVGTHIEFGDTEAKQEDVKKDTKKSASNKKKDDKSSSSSSTSSSSDAAAADSSQQTDETAATSATSDTTAEAPTDTAQVQDQTQSTQVQAPANNTTQNNNSSTPANSGSQKKQNTSAPAQSRSSASSQKSASAQPVHQHTWVPVYKTVHHDAVTHVVHHNAVTQPKYTTKWYSRCKKCGKILYTEQEVMEHTGNGDWDALFNGGTDPAHPCLGANTENVPVQTYAGEEVVKPAYDETVTDRAAYDEKVLTGYRCSTCGATK